jgi:hypothetical protein
VELSQNVQKLGLTARLHGASSSEQTFVDIPPTRERSQLWNYNMRKETQVTIHSASR